MVESLGLGRQASSNAELVDWDLDYEIDYDYSLQLDRNIVSGHDEPKLTRGFSFTVISDAEIEP
jgi:hypothetical protein